MIFTCSKLRAKSREPKAKMPHLPKIVRQRLQGPTNASNLHPDADVLTAFAEKSLPDSERAHVTDHLARCGDCREIVALALPATKETTVVGRSAGTAWRTGWFLRWGVVAAGIALAASVGIVQLRERHLMHVADSALSRQEVAATTPTPAGHLASDGVEDGRVKRDRVPGRNMEQETRAASKTDTDQEKFAPGIASRVAPQPSRGESAKASRLYPGTAAGAAGSSTGREAKFAMAAPPRDLNFARSLKNSADAPAVAQKQLPPRSSRPGATSETVQVTAPAPALQAEPATVDDQPQSELSLDKAQVAKAKPPLSNGDLSAPPAAAAPTEARAPMPPQSEVAEVYSASASRWTISPIGVLQRSVDGGKTWRDVNVNAPSALSTNYVQTRNAPPQTETARAKKAGSSSPEASFTGRTVFRAVSAAGGEVWAGGMSGVLYHSSDGGETWTRVIPAAAGVTLIGDILSIEFTDQQNGKLTTSHPEIWTTSDAGHSWQKR